MTRMRKYEDMVRLELENRPETRDNDNRLTLYIWRDFYGVGLYEPVSEVLLNDKLPSIESIGRVRRRIQEKDETLRGTRKRESERMTQQKDILDYVGI